MLDTAAIVERQIELAVACLRVAAELGSSVARHGLKVLTAERPDLTAGTWSEAFTDAPATDRAAVERAIRACVAAALADQSRAEQAIRGAVTAIIDKPDPLALLAEAEEKHGKRNAASVVARKLTDDPLEREAIAQNLRRRRRKARRCSFATTTTE